MTLSQKLIGINLLGAVALMGVVASAVLGFEHAKERWDHYQNTVVLEQTELEAIGAEMGYTGLIHELKNYVLRGEEHYFDQVQFRHKTVHQHLDRYATIEGLNSQELQAIDTLREMADKYHGAAERVKGVISDRNGAAATATDIPELDALARIDDRPYEKALQTLRNNAQARSVAHGEALSDYFSWVLSLIVIFAVCGLALILGAGTYLARWVARSEAAKERELSEQRDVADAANQAKSAFLASVSHEVRTPMTAILGFADLLAEPGCDEQAREDYVATIRRNGEHLLTILNDVLDLSKIEAGRMTSEIREVPIRQLVEEVISLMRVRAIERNLSLSVEFMPGVPDHAMTDPLRLRQVLINLVGNALKFTEEGGVRVVVRGNRANSWLSCEVIDTGVGMSPEQMDRLFKPFAQGDNTMVRRFGGTGLGLTLCKRFIEMLGGRLSVCSTQGEGSAFWFNLPIQAQTQETTDEQDSNDTQTPALVEATREGQAEEQPEEQPLAPLTGRVLLAEDGPDNQRLVRHMVTQFGLTIDIVENGRDAVERVLDAVQQARPYDVVLMDMQMPVMDGYAATTELRNLDYTGWVIALTAHAMSEDRHRCLDAGCDEYLSKPIDKAGLRQLLGRLIQQQRQAA